MIWWISCSCIFQTQTCSRGQSWRWESTAEEGTKCRCAPPESGLLGGGAVGEGGGIGVEGCIGGRNLWQAPSLRSHLIFTSSWQWWERWFFSPALCDQLYIWVIWRWLRLESQEYTSKSNLWTGKPDDQEERIPVQSRGRRISPQNAIAHLRPVCASFQLNSHHRCMLKMASSQSHQTESFLNAIASPSTFPPE